jgi:hypothetical protein
MIFGGKVTATLFFKIPAFDFSDYLGHAESAKIIELIYLGMFMTRNSSSYKI